ncbi:MAG: two-component system activity regulator YycH, partial [Bacillota bacterium]|nr:two-component system activity regulator YycH [Bacillota bacterium]
MNRITRERLKSFILLILLLTSIIQVGILWSYQNHGFPISFFSGIFGGQNSPTAASSEEFFKPFRFTVSDGDGSYWMMYPKDSTYTKVWQDIKNNYLPKLFSGSRAEQSSEQYSEEDWGNLVKKKSFFLDFNTDIKADLLSAFLNIDSSS